jgi:hypothetical protein
MNSHFVDTMRVKAPLTGVYQGALNLLAIYDATLSTHLETSITFRGTSNRIQNDIIRAASDVVLEKIKSEIINSTFVALLPDETSDIMNYVSSQPL